MQEINILLEIVQGFLFVYDFSFFSLFGTRLHMTGWLDALRHFATLFYNTMARHFGVSCPSSSFLPFFFWCGSVSGVRL